MTRNEFIQRAVLAMAATHEAEGALSQATALADALVEANVRFDSMTEVEALDEVCGVLERIWNDMPGGES
jgi:hypothetical protein